MSTAQWQAGTLYIPGSLVRPRSGSAVVQSAPTNGDFELGSSGWTLGTGLAIGEFSAAFSGTFSLEYDDNDPAVRVAINNNAVPVRPGQSIKASCQVQQGGSSAGQAGGTIFIRWLTSGMASISEDFGNTVSSGSGGQWKITTVTAAAPPTAAYAQLGIGMFRLSGASPVYADLASWDYVYSAPPDGLIFQATQALSGYSGSAEPNWPTSVGNTVVDNEVTWEAVLTSRVTYEAHPILKSGSSEPTFPTDIGGTVADGTIIWEATARQITDARCPQSKYVITGASKVFAGDDDIIPFSATNNPLDWSTKDDAGFLPFGLQRFGSKPVLGLGLYRANLVAFNEQGAQMWQIDEDPQNMALLDAVPVGSRYHRSIQPVANDIAFLTDVGIRNFGIAAASTNLQAGDFAKPIDPLVKAAIQDGSDAIGLFYPGTGQYMLFLGQQAFVLTWNGVGPRAVSRSRYELPSAVDDWTVLDGVLYLRSGDLVWRFDEAALADDMYDAVALLESGTFAGVGIYNGFEGYNIFTATAFGEQLFSTLQTHVLLWAHYNPTAGRFEVGISNIFGEEIDGVRIYAGAEFDPAPAVLVASFDVADAVVSDPGSVGGGPDGAVYDGVREYQWTAPNPLDDLETFTIQIVNFASERVANVVFPGRIEWPYLDLQAFGDDVMLHGFDLVGTGEVDVSFGYNQSDLDAVTDAYTVQADTLNGMPIAMPIKAPSVQLRLEFSGNQLWSWQAARLYDSPVIS